jgi:hypothetical protein
VDDAKRDALRHYVQGRVEISENGCWEWKLSSGSHGYPQGSIEHITGQRVSLAHRLSYQAFVGEIPEGAQVDHLCRNRNCVRPDHLEAVSQQVNIRRQYGLPEDLSKCARGHVGKRRRDSRGMIFCAVCHSESNKAYRQRKISGK